jgi:hypothetical protein
MGGTVSAGYLYSGGNINCAGSFGASGSVAAGSYVYTNWIFPNGGSYTTVGGGLLAQGGPGWAFICSGLSYLRGDVRMDGGGNSIIMYGSGGWQWNMVVGGGVYWQLGDLSGGYCVIECIPQSAKTWLEGTSACNGDWLVMGGIYGNLCETRFKNNVQPFTSGLAEICKLRPVSFNYNQDPLYPDAWPDRKMKNHLPSTRQIAVMADEAFEVFPELISEEQDICAHQPAEGLPPNRGRLIKINALQYAMVNAIRELSEQVAALTAQVTQLQGRA